MILKTNIILILNKLFEKKYFVYNVTIIFLTEWLSFIQ